MEKRVDGRQAASPVGQGEAKNEAPFTRRIKTVVKKRKPSAGGKRRVFVCQVAKSLVGIQEQPPGSHSNDGPDVHRIQSSTGAYRAPWCVSTVQYEDLHTPGVASTYADGTANAYYYADYAIKHGHAVDKPVAGCAVIYHLGAGHAGRVVDVLPDGRFYAVEGNEGDAVREVLRDPKQIGCTFVLRPEYR